jgi:sugar phosphate isomerase/epimerase
MAAMTRRELLAAATFAGTLRAAPAVRFGVRAPLPKTGLRERAQLVKRLGYDGIELGPEWLDQPASAIRQQVAGTVPVSAIVGSLQLLNPDPQKRSEAVELDRRRIALAKDIGAEFVIEVPIFGKRVIGPNEVEDKLLISGLKQLAPDLERSGVTILLEPLTRKETHYMNLQAHGASIIEAAGPNGLRLLSDFYHMQMEEKDIADTLNRYGKYTAYVHLADGEKRTEPGSLPFDYRPGFRALKKAGFHGWLTMESSATDSPEAALARALTYIKRQWAEA